MSDGVCRASGVGIVGRLQKIFFLLKNGVIIAYALGRCNSPGRGLTRRGDWLSLSRSIAKT